MQTVLALLKSNAYWLIPMLIIIATNVANKLLKNPTTEVLGHTILDVVSFLPRADSGQKIKMLGKRSARKPSLAPIVSTPPEAQP